MNVTRKRLLLARGEPGSTRQAEEMANRVPQ
jgi:hypothetical protein